jgi:hypothetical protein
MSGNMDLWHKVEKTPESQTKKITGKSYQGTSPKPHYLIQKATETFGPCGIGWGFTVEERIEQGAMISDGFFEKMSIAKVKVWYKWDGERGEVEHIGGTVFSGRYSSGKTFTDEDAPKKSVTDALIKALSMIGFAGDIFMGRYDDSKYVSDLKQEEKAAASKPADKRPNYDESDAVQNLWAEIIELKSERALASFWKDNVKTILGMDENARRSFIVKKDELKAKFAGNVVNDIQDTFPGSTVVNETVREQHVLEAG